jgi:hypothetical protein
MTSENQLQFNYGVNIELVESGFRTTQLIELKIQSIQFNQFNSINSIRTSELN